MVLDGDVGSVLATGLFAFYAQAQSPTTDTRWGRRQVINRRTQLHRSLARRCGARTGPTRCFARPPVPAGSQADAGYRFRSALSAAVGAYNLLNRQGYDIEYYYASQLRGESAPVNGIHFHPTEPRSVRANLTYRF